MLDYNQRIQSQQRNEEIARNANASKPEGRAHFVPNLFDKLFAALKPAQKAQKPAQSTSRKPARAH